MKKLLVLLLTVILASVLLVSCDLFELPNGNGDGNDENGGKESGDGSGNDGSGSGGIFGEGGADEGETVTVTFDSDGGSAVQSQIIPLGENATMPANPTKSAYIFDGWTYYQNGLEIDWDFEYMPVTQSITLKARWIPFYPKFNATTDTFGCTCTRYNDYPAMVGESITVTTTIALGYDFIGWYEGQTLVSSNIQYTFTMPERDLTYTAKFKAKPEMEKFSFYSGSEACGISKLNDKTITDLVIPEYVTYIDSYAFSDCTQLKSITFLGELDNIHDHAFINCTSLKTLTFNGAVREIGEDAFEGCAAIETVNVNDIKGWCNTGFYDENCNPINIAKKFYHNGNLVTNLVIPDDVEYIGYCAFYGCETLKSVSIGNSVESIGGLAFAACTGITSITVPNSVTGVGFGAFAGCTSLQSITLSDNIRYIDASLFSGCSSLQSIQLPDNIYEIDEYAFYGCTSLKSVNIPLNVTKISKFAFYDCRALERIDFDAKSCKDSLDTRFIFVNAGIDGNGITVVFGDTVENIPAKMFYNSGIRPATQKQPNIKTVIIGKNVTKIGQQAFYNCTTIKSIKYKGTNTQWETIEKGGYWNKYRVAPDDQVIDYEMSYNYTGE